MLSLQRLTVVGPRRLLQEDDPSFLVPRLEQR